MITRARQPTSASPTFTADLDGSYDSDGGFAGDIAGKGDLLVNDLGTLADLMGGIMLIDQEILDLQAFLDSPLIQP